MNCTNSLSTSGAMHDAGPAYGSFTVAADGGCIWTASAPGWITLQTGSDCQLSGIGSGKVCYYLSENFTGNTRTGSISIYGGSEVQTFTVSQAPCAYAISASDVAYGPGPTNGSLTVTTESGCIWIASASGGVTLGTGPGCQVSGTGSGTVCYFIGENNTATPRIATISVYGGPSPKVLTITQDSCAPCSRGNLPRLVVNSNDPECIDATFTPQCNLPLNAAATTCGFDHFNWYSVVLFTPHPPLGLGMSFIDPPSGGGAAFSGWADNLPFYFDESGDPLSPYHLANHTKPYVLDFKECPRNPTLSPGQKTFWVTSLVGVYPDGRFAVLDSFSWSSSFDGNGGGITLYRNLFAASGGSGEVAVIQTNIPLAGLPASVLQKMAQDGAVNVPPALSVQWVGPSLQVSWPTNFLEYVLESKAASVPGPWTTVTGVTNNSVSVPISSFPDTRFYRLRKNVGTP